uniref:EGF-like domain-containing protein n=1 Tax=Timema monikensis TaxID=170555 RepID=A0A7R9HPT3_9NEOP|nr:unnamed protein product [Timema monikensis]
MTPNCTDIPAEASKVNGVYSSPVASLVLTDSSELTSDSQHLVSGRTCKSDDNCAGIANTTCMNDPRDNKMRCLCPDKAGPINGHCPPKKKVESCSKSFPEYKMKNGDSPEIPRIRELKKDPLDKDTICRAPAHLETSVAAGLELSGIWSVNKSLRRLLSVQKMRLGTTSEEPADSERKELVNWEFSVGRECSLKYQSEVAANKLYFSFSIAWVCFRWPFVTPGFPCNNDDECVRGATCISPNSTRATGQKLCRCKHEDDDEDDDECSSKCAEDSHFDLSFVGSNTAGRMSHFDKCHLIDSMVI